MENDPKIGNLLANYLPKWGFGGKLENSQLYDNGLNVGIGTVSPQAKLHVAGNMRISGDVVSSGSIEGDRLYTAHEIPL